MIAVFLFLLWSMTQPTALSYPTYDPTGAVTASGSYAFFNDTSVITTYEAARSSATTLRIHTIDGANTSRAALLDHLAIGDLFEWRQAADCFVRYEVTGDPVRQEATREISVTWITYAFTGCTGTIPAAARSTMTVGSLPDLGGLSLTAPIRHAIWQIVPEGWTGAMEPARTIRGVRVTNGPYFTLAEARRLPRWRDPVVPNPDWTFSSAVTDPTTTPYGYEANWSWGRGEAFAIRGEQVADVAYRTEAAVRGPTGLIVVAETRQIAGRPGMVYYSPAGPLHAAFYGNVVRVHDRATESEYTIYAGSWSLRGSNIDALIAIAESLFREDTQ